MIDQAQFEHFCSTYFSRTSVEEIKRLNRFTPEVETQLSRLAPLVAGHIETIISKFYGYLLNIERNRNYFRDEDQIKRLQNINRKSFVRAFTPPFDQQYFMDRIKVGFKHHLIDLSPDLYIGALGALESALKELWDEQLTDRKELADAYEATARMLKVELQLTLDAYFGLSRLAVETAHKKVSEVLDNLKEGFLSIRADRKVEMASRSCQAIFGRNVQGCSLDEAFSIIPREKALFMMEAMDQLFENFMPLELNLSLLPSQITDQQGRILSFHYTPVCDSQGHPQKLIVSLSDVTEETRKAQDIVAENELNRCLVNLLRDKEAFTDFLDDFSRDVRLLEQCGDLVVGRRILHTLKGNSFSFGLLSIGQHIHELEERLDEVGTVGFLAVASADVAHTMEAFLNKNEAVLNLSIHGNDRNEFLISADQVKELGHIMKAQTKPDIEARIQAIVSALPMRSIRSLTSTYDATIQRLAHKLKKKVHFHLAGDDLRVDPEREGAIFRQLVHAIRNALDHGIETPDLRLEEGKPEQATVSLAVAQTDRELTIELRDDGRGIDVKRLALKAIAKGLVTEQYVQNATQENLVNLVFADGVSTAAEVTDLSGRGVGMSALKATVEDLQGHIRIKTEAGVGTSILIQLPRMETGRLRMTTPA